MNEQIGFRNPITIIGVVGLGARTIELSIRIRKSPPHINPSGAPVGLSQFLTVYLGLTSFTLFFLTTPLHLSSAYLTFIHSLVQPGCTARVSSLTPHLAPGWSIMRTTSSSFIIAATIFASVSTNPGVLGSEILGGSANDLTERALKNEAPANVGRSHVARTFGANEACPLTFVCDGTGNDGYLRDIAGKAAPSGYPSSFRYFGPADGWQPTRGWQCGKTWKAPVKWLPECSKATWWAPTKGWTPPSGFQAPSFWHRLGWQSGASGSAATEATASATATGWKWGWGKGNGGSASATGTAITAGASGASVKPPVTWVCNKTGKDGYHLDHSGASLPSVYPSGWLYFGVGYGWGPPAGWVNTDSFKLPSLWIPHIYQYTWWSPIASWKCPATVYPPTWWPQHGHSGISVGSASASAIASGSSAGSSAWPSISWECNKSGKDGYHFDHTGASLPSQYPTGWLYFGIEYGWGPPAGWVCTDSFKVPALWAPHIYQYTWWSPIASWKCPSTIYPPTWWPQHGHSGSSTASAVASGSSAGAGAWPSIGWTCNKTGKDGYHAYGWGPPAGWVCTDSFKVPTLWIPHIPQYTWWSPIPTWQCPSNIYPPTWWPQHGHSGASSSGWATIKTQAPTSSGLAGSVTAPGSLGSAPLSSQISSGGLAGHDSYSIPSGGAASIPGFGSASSLSWSAPWSQATGSNSIPGESNTGTQSETYSSGLAGHGSSASPSTGAASNTGYGSAWTSSSSWTAPGSQATGSNTVPSAESNTGKVPEIYSSGLAGHGSSSSPSSGAASNTGNENNGWNHTHRKLTPFLVQVMDQHGLLRPAGPLLGPEPRVRTAFLETQTLEPKTFQETRTLVAPGPVLGHLKARTRGLRAPVSVCIYLRALFADAVFRNAGLPAYGSSSPSDIGGTAWTSSSSWSSPASQATGSDTIPGNSNTGEGTAWTSSWSSEATGSNSNTEGAWTISSSSPGSEASSSVSSVLNSGSFLILQPFSQNFILSALDYGTTSTSSPVSAETTNTGFGGTSSWSSAASVPTGSHPGDYNTGHATAWTSSSLASSATSSPVGGASNSQGEGTTWSSAWSSSSSPEVYSNTQTGFSSAIGTGSVESHSASVTGHHTPGHGHGHGHGHYSHSHPSGSASSVAPVATGSQSQSNGAWTSSWSSSAASSPVGGASSSHGKSGQNTAWSSAWLSSSSPVVHSTHSSSSAIATGSVKITSAGVTGTASTTVGTAESLSSSVSRGQHTPGSGSSSSVATGHGSTGAFTHTSSGLKPTKTSFPYKVWSLMEQIRSI
ncbi:hypothetical protein P7C70_g6784, partial [Phenoliferia sp. Uapishka_3]